MKTQLEWICGDCDQRNWSGFEKLPDVGHSKMCNDRCTSCHQLATLHVVVPLPIVTVHEIPGPIKCAPYEHRWIAASAPGTGPKTEKCKLCGEYRDV